MSGFDPTPEDEALFEELRAELLEWVGSALDRAPPDMVSAVVCAVACGGAVHIGVPLDVFIREMKSLYEKLKDEN